MPQPNVELYRDDRSGFSYRIADTTDIDTFRAAIEALPGQESPEIYGLHPNADLTFRTLQVQEAMSTILDTMPKGAGGGGGLSREETVDHICQDLLSKVGGVCICGAVTLFPNQQQVQPIARCFCQEGR
jgi:dynein heavy chain